MSTIDAINIKADALIGNTSVNSMTIRGEGSNVTNIQQGLNKSWINANCSANSITDSLNVTSVVDEGTGKSRINFVTNMLNATFSVVSHDWSYGNGWSDTFTTGGYDVKRRNESAAYIDVTAVFSNVLGDLS